MRAYLEAKTKVETKSAGGLVTQSWVHAFYFYALTVSQKASESFANMMPGIRSTIIFQTWLRADITRDMRVIYNADQYNITGVTPEFKTMTLECERVEP